MNSATELAREVVGALLDAGVRHVVLCPGSRSAPLAYAVYDAATAGRLELHVRHDERVAGFTALGLGRATGQPAAVVTTSGTAVANLHPSVLEAHHGRVPLLVLAADRPPALRGTWANQTSDLQAEMFGAATRFARDLAPSDAASEWLDAVRTGVELARGGELGPGPVHLNLGFDEPLVPAPDDQVWAGPPLDTGPESSPEPRHPLTGAEGLRLRDRSVVLAGDRAWPGALDVAARLDLPLLAEPTSGVRGGPNAVAAYRLLLDRDDLGGRIEQVLVFGRPTLSRPVTRLLARPDVEVVLASTYPADPGPGRPDVRRMSPDDLEAWSVHAATDSAPAPSDRAAWRPGWVEAGRAAARAVDGVLDGWPVLTGPIVAREVAVATGPGDALVLAASNPVRDLDLAGAPWTGPATSRLVHANRGLSGIDGTVSTATGIALGSGRPTRVLVGDVALLHDLGALVLGPADRRPDLTVIVVNDSGGGIFSLLEPGADAERDERSAARFERTFGTPHRVDLAAVCAGLGVEHRVVASTAGLREHLGRTPQGLSVIEVTIDREDLRPLHEAIARAVHP